jgi:hypothetical protein
MTIRCRKPEVLDEDLREYWRDVTAKPASRTYKGSRNDRVHWGKCVVTVTCDGRTRPLARHTKIRNHSPTGFEWGYNGSGPAQLALALLMDVLGSDHKERALVLYQDFKSHFIANLPKAGWTLTTEQILDAVSRLEGPGKGGDRGG